MEDNLDKLSQLPKTLLLRILSLLPTKKVVTMSVLSKLWLSLTKIVPNFEFICDEANDFEIYSDYVCRFLLSHESPALQSLDLEINCAQGSSLDIGTMIGIAFGLHVRKLVLSVFTSDDISTESVISTERFFKFPRSLYNHTTLETLKLESSVLLDVPVPVCLKSLKTLHLVLVHYKDDESVVNLLSGCSSLENLVVCRKYNDDVNTFPIAVPTLRKLKLHHSADMSLGYVINAPSLKYLRIEGAVHFGSNSFESTLDLEELDIRICGNTSMGLLTSAKHLSLLSTTMFVAYPTTTGNIFHGLESLKLHTNMLDLLPYMLDNSPKLQALELTGITDNPQMWSRPENVAKCLSHHLQTLVCTYFRGIPQENDVVKYILRNAHCLRKVTFCSSFIRPGNRPEIVAELESQVNASNSSCQILFK